MSRLLAAALVAAALSSAARAEGADGWTLAWSSEFDGPAGTAPDPKKWTYDLGGDGWGNQELETYCAPTTTAAPCDPEKPNAALDGKGRLAIRAFKSADGRWTSARLKTVGLEQPRFGRIEAKMKLPTGAGLWPAFWMLGADHAKIVWPDCGEIDLMENVPEKVPGGLGPNKIKATVHGPGYSGTNGIGKVVALPAGGRVDDGFHVYGAIWSPKRISFYVDDPKNIFFTATPKSLPKGRKWVYDKPFFLIMNLAVGGSWPKDPDAKTPDPATMLVNWVRVYRAAP